MSILEAEGRPGVFEGAKLLHQAPSGAAAKQRGVGLRDLHEKRPPTQVDDLFRGDSRIRTGDPLLAKQVLYQLSYTPECCAGQHR